MNIFKRSLVASVATSFVVAGGLAPVVVALEDPTPGDTNQEQSQSYSLTIHKRIGANVKVDEYDGSALTNPPGADAGEGFEFSITQVTPATGADADNAGAATEVPGGHNETGATNSEGKVKFENLPAGVYRVSETKAPDQYVKSQDFLVSVPMTAADGRTMINDVVAYPKNTEASVEKTVKDADVHGGEEYAYTIEANIPAPAQGDKLVSYRIVDNLDGRLAAPGADKVSVRLSGEGQTLVDSDYNVTITPGENGGAHTIEAKFSDTGLTKLEEARKAGQSVVMEIKATAPADVQVIPNQATQYFNNGNGEGELDRKSDEVKTYWGKLTVVKTEAGTENKLQGAEFQLVRCQADEDGIYKQVAGTDPLSVNGQTTWTTNEEGTFTVTGIHASDFADNASVDPVVTYCAQETKAPSGFQLDKTLIPFVLTASESERALREGDTRGVYEYGINMKNHKSQLPNTGGMGIGLLIVLGLLVIGGGAYAARRNTAAA